MFKLTRIAVRAAGEGKPVELPLRIAYHLPRYVTDDPSRFRFNLPGALAQLLSSAGPDRLQYIARIDISAPGWSATDLRNLVPSGSPPQFAGLAGEDPFAGGPHAIHHWTGRAESTPEDDVQWLVGPSGGEGGALRAGAFRDSLVRDRVRLLVLHNTDLGSYASEMARGLGEFIAGGGGPAVMVVEGTSPEALDRFLYDVYAAILHNRPLDEAGQFATDPSLNVHFFAGINTERSLDLRPVLERLEMRIRNVHERAELQRQSIQLQEAQGDEAGSARRFTEYLHRGQQQRFQALSVDPFDNLSADIEAAVKQFRDIAEKPWQHENEGIIPLSDLANTVPLLERQGDEAGAKYREIQSILSEEAEDASRRAPRVLNANFADPARSKIIDPRQPLVVGREYDLLVDIGPRWSKLTSLVTGNKDFPEKALDPDKEGWEIEAVLVSEDFEPTVASGRLWLPRGTGRSFPVVDGRKGEKSGPILLRVRVSRPPTDVAANARLPDARGRLCLYYENNLLQSAMVRVGRAAEGVPPPVLESDNEARVDYVMSGTFQSLERFGQRAVRFKPDDPGQEQVALNLTLNDDGAAGHRIVIRGKLAPAANGGGGASGNESGPAIGWSPYNPSDADGTLTQARQELARCFFDREPGQHYALSPTNSKRFKPFQRDLEALALLGNKLFAKVASQIRTRDGGTAAADWKDQLRQALADASIIQVARTGNAEYVLPWALVYDIPLPGPELRLKFCPIVKEWEAGDGLRASAVVERKCPYLDTVDHAENILCPYGFWGLKHIIEQPVSTTAALWQASEPRDGETQMVVPSGQTPQLAVAVATDPKIDAVVAQHLKHIGKLSKLRFTPPAAIELGKVRELLSSPNVVYFICHGSADADGPFLSIGNGGAGGADYSNYRIYPTTVTGWRDTTKLPNLRGWAQRRPLVVINGCHTCDLKPSEMLSIASQFSYAGASGIVGTEVNIDVNLAAEVGEALLAKTGDGVPLGQAIRQIRWDLANKGNLLGLAYTAYAFADLRLVYVPVAATSATTPSTAERIRGALGMPAGSC